MHVHMFGRLLAGRRRRIHLEDERRNGVEKESPTKSISRHQWKQRLSQETVNKQDLDSLIFDFLSIEGYREAAETFRQETNLSCSHI